MLLGKDTHGVEEQACETQLGGSGSRKIRNVVAVSLRRVSNVFRQ